MGGLRFVALLFYLDYGDRLVIIQERVDGLSEAALAKFVTRARRLAGVRGMVSILVTSSRELQGLNRRFRGKNKPTDVLSFPAMAGLTQEFAGDVAISAEIAARNARQLGHTAAEEIRILVLHGLLHLAGYDHEHDDGKMERKEARLRKSLRLPVALIERSRRRASKRVLSSTKSGSNRRDVVHTVSKRTKAGVSSPAKQASR
jgi:probable rRNA maturation factor